MLIAAQMSAILSFLARIISLKSIRFGVYFPVRIISFIQKECETLRFGFLLIMIRMIMPDKRIFHHKITLFF